MLSNMPHITFGFSWALYLLLLVPLLIIFYWYKKEKYQGEMKMSGIEWVSGLRKSKKVLLYHLPFILRIIAITLLIIALSRPQIKLSRHESSVEGIDIVISLDISTTMLSEDFRPNRLEAAKAVALDFIEGRKNDRIGLVVFSGESFTQCPLTTDHVSLKNLFLGVKSGLLDDGTAIGDGLATAVARLRNSNAISKVIILLTDGLNNSGLISPITAAELAKTMGVRVYTIGVGSYGMAPYPFKTPYGIQYQNIPVEIDEQLLKSISNMTGGKYYRATDKNKLEEIYKDIDKLEKTKIDVIEFSRKREIFFPFLLASFVIFTIEILLRYLYLKKIP